MNDAELIPLLVTWAAVTIPAGIIGYAGVNVREALAAHRWRVARLVGAGCGVIGLAAMAVFCLAMLTGLGFLFALRFLSDGPSPSCMQCD